MLASPALSRFFGWIGFMLFSLGTFFLTSKIFGLDFMVVFDGRWNLGVKGTIIMIVSIIVGLFGLFVGVAIGATVKVESDKVNFIISCLWSYLANGNIIWLFCWSVCLAILVGRSNAVEFNELIGVFPWLSLFFLPLIAFPLATSLLLLTKLLNYRYPPTMFSSIVIFPAVAFIAHKQMEFFMLSGSAWIIISVIVSILIVPISTGTILRDLIQRSEAIRM
jgi:hypothetical protein